MNLLDFEEQLGLKRDMEEKNIWDMNLFRFGRAVL
jgi:hypothetical protein